MLKTFRVRQPYSLLLAARRSMDDTDFTRLLRAIVVISLRYNVIGAYGTGEQERVYNTVAEQIATGKLQSIQGVLKGLQSIYVEDRRFKAAFADKVIRTTDSRNNRVVRWILCGIEKHLSGQDHSFSSDAFGIEHVLPQSAPDGWGEFRNDEAAQFLYRLGNMTLLSSGSNRRAGNLSYAEKRKEYAASGFHITRKLAEDNAEWTPERLLAWQSWMADQASSIWRIGEFG